MTAKWKGGVNRFVRIRVNPCLPFPKEGIARAGDWFRMLQFLRLKILQRTIQTVQTLGRNALHRNIQYSSHRVDVTFRIIIGLHDNIVIQRFKMQHAIVGVAQVIEAIQSA